MINEIISMNGYGAYVWSAFSFTLIGFTSLYFVTKLQLSKEQKSIFFISCSFLKQYPNITKA